MQDEASTKTLSLEAALAACARRKGPVAALLCETGSLARRSADHLLECGFGAVLALGPGASSVGDDAPGIICADAAILAPRDRSRTLNRVISALEGRWMLVCFNGDFLYYPFAETRGVQDLIEFQSSERRRAVMGYAIDLYSEAMRDGGEPDLDDAYFDLEGWYGFEASDRQVNIYGGLGWRYEEYMPLALTRINRPALFRADKGVSLDETLWLNDPEMNTVACPWHNNPTIALMSFRRARTLLAHPKFSGGVAALKWRHSVKFEWRAEQLVESGLIEAGQWI